MLINQDFSVDRTKYIGGSDIGAILGLSKYRTPLEVWLEKTGKEVASKDSLPMRFGSFAEEFVAREYARATNTQLAHDQSTYIHPEHSYMCAHLDRFVLGKEKALPTKILECKTANAFAKSDWGQVGSDEVPMSYLAQCAWYMAITGIEQTDLAVLFGNHEFRIYEITRDQDLEKLVLQKANDFWHKHVLKDIAPPASSVSDCQLLFSQGKSDQRVEADMAMYESTKQLQFLNAQIAQHEEEASNIKQRLMSAMGQAESLHYRGQLLATWKAPKTSYRLDAKRIEQERPDLFEQYRTPVQNSRRLVVKNLHEESI